MYAELHCHSAFSFLDGASLPDELVPTALELGYETLGLTDHNSVSGSMEFAVSARALGLRPIHGAEVDLEDGRHLTLLVQDAEGWRNLCRILTRAHARTRGPEIVGSAITTVATTDSNLFLKSTRTPTGRQPGADHQLPRLPTASRRSS